MLEKIEQFKNHLINEEKAEATVNKYVHDVALLYRWLGNRELCKEAVREYKAFLEKYYTATSVNTMLSSLNSFFDWHDCPEYKVKNLKIQKKTFIAPNRDLTKDEYERLLQAALDLGRNRIYYVMQTICATGIRVSELKYITVEAVKKGIANAKRRNGDFVGACTVYGYKKAEDNKNQLVIDEYAATVVRDIFQMRIDGISAAGIADELNRKGVLSPSEYKKRNNIPIPRNGYAYRNNSQWSATTIIRILKDEIYTGRLIQGKQGTPNYKIKELVDRPREEQFITENAHEAIISEKDFILVKRLMNIDTRVSPLKDNLHLFSGILICGHCGNRMTRKTVSYKGNKYFYYYCPTGKKNGCAASNMVKESDLIQCVTESMRAHIRSVLSLDTLLDNVSRKNINQCHIKKCALQITELQNQLDKCSSFKSRLYENYVTGVLDKAEYRDLKQRYSEECERFRNSITELEQEIKDCENNTAKRLEWIECLKQFEDISVIDRRIVVSLITSIHIFSKNKIQLTFRYNEEYAKALIALEEMKEAI